MTGSGDDSEENPEAPVAPTVPVAAEPMLEYARRLPRRTKPRRFPWLNYERGALLAALVAASLQALFWLKVFEWLYFTSPLSVAVKNPLVDVAFELVVFVCFMSALALPIAGVVLGVYAFGPRGKHKSTAAVAIVFNALLFLGLIQWFRVMLEEHATR